MVEQPFRPDQNLSKIAIPQWKPERLIGWSRQSITTPYAN